MANRMTWDHNVNGAKAPFRVLGLFAAGSTATNDRGDILELTANSNTEWITMNSDFAGNANVAVAGEEILDGDLAGYYWIIVPRPGDVFEFILSAAGNPSIGASLYWSAAQTVAETGSNVLGRMLSTSHYPKQGRKSIDGGASPDAGVVIPNTPGTRVLMGFDPDVSYYRALFPQT